MPGRRLSTIVPAAALALVVLGVSAWALASTRGSAGGDETVVPAVARTPVQEVAQAQALLRRNGRNDRALAELAGGSLDLVRETGDPSWYAKAEEAGRRALDDQPAQRRRARRDGRPGQLPPPLRRGPGLRPAQPRRGVHAGSRRYGIEGDALVELGRYRQGFAVIERRLELRPDLPSYSRASYVQELRGNRAGAIRLMELAVGAGGPGTEGRAWTQVQLGLLRFGSGDLAGAEREMRAVLAQRPGDARATAGPGQGAGRPRPAGPGRRALPPGPGPPAPARVPGRPGRDRPRARAAGRGPRGPRAGEGHAAPVRRQRRARRPRPRRSSTPTSTGPAPAAIARARAAYRTRPGIIGDDILGWVLTRAGHCGESLRYARRSLRLGTRDALMRFHAGMAAACAGRPAEAAARLREALALNPRFSVRWAPVARRTLERVAPS